MQLGVSSFNHILKLSQKMRADLDLDVAGILHQLLNKHAPVPEGRQGLRAGPLETLLQAVVCTLGTLRQLCRPEVGPSDQLRGVITPIIITIITIIVIIIIVIR